MRRLEHEVLEEAELQALLTPALLHQPRWRAAQQGVTGMEPDRTIAYFSMEIALEVGMPTYSGGLGVLAGDTVRAAAISTYGGGHAPAPPGVFFPAPGCAGLATRGASSLGHP